MPLNKNIKKVLIVGSGPIVIGQAAEFDYSGTQACQAFKEENIETVLINSNPATIMTDEEIADRVYIEPVTYEFVEKIIEKERPDAIIAGMGGQTGLNVSVELNKRGILEKYNVAVIGTQIEAIERGEDRELFRKAMEKVNQPIIESEIAESVKEAKEFMTKMGLPLIVRPAYTMGGTGGGIASTEEEFLEIAKSGLSYSPTNQILIEKSIKGWKEIEYEVVRDSFKNAITVCNMENIDPVGIHTGDSIVVAPSQTITDKQYQMLRKASIDIVNEIEVIGACNVQFAMKPDGSEYAVIEINPRVSRSSALASKATGYPIAKVAAKVAMGYGLHEIKNAVTNKTYACFEPALDYIVTKIPKWPFDKFGDANRELGTKMMATGEVMAIGRTFEESFMKAIRSLENGNYMLTNEKYFDMSLSELKKLVVKADDERIFALCEMLRRDYRAEKISEITKIDNFFTNKLKNIIKQEEEIKASGITSVDKESLLMMKKTGFSDKAIAKLTNKSPDEIFTLRKLFNIMPSYKMVDTCAGEFEASSSYYYSTYDEEDEVCVTNNKKIMVIGSGPIRIGQGIEFDYASVHCVKALKELGYETIIVNNNPETVSTDFDISDKLYFEPLVEEDVYNIIEKEKPYGVVLQFGGQTAIKLAKFLSEKKVNILGADFDIIDRAEDRDRFEQMLEKLKIDRPKGIAVTNLKDGIEGARNIGYPVLVRPSYVLGGRGMEILNGEIELKLYLKEEFKKSKKNPILIDRYIMGRELEVDAICDGEGVFIPGVMEHLERTGVHSGDSTTIYPTQNVSDKVKQNIFEITNKIAKELKLKGMINIQFIENNGDLSIIEVNPRASRTVPYISKMSKIKIVELAVKVMTGSSIEDLGYEYGIHKEPNIIAVKVPVFSTQKLPNVEMSLGPEMKSTGEVLGIGRNFEEAMYKGMLAAGIKFDIKNKNILATIKEADKKEFVDLAKRINKIGYSFVATNGTSKLLQKNDVCSKEVNKIGDESPDVLDVIKNKEVSIVINTPTKGKDSKRDGFKMRRTAIENGLCTFTSLDTFDAFIKVLESNINTQEMKVYDISKKF